MCKSICAKQRKLSLLYNIMQCGLFVILRFSKNFRNMKMQEPTISTYELLNNGTDCALQSATSNYRDPQKILKREDDFQTQAMTLNIQMSMGHINCAVFTDSSHICFVTTSNTLVLVSCLLPVSQFSGYHCVKHSFLVITVLNIIFWLSLY